MSSLPRVTRAVRWPVLASVALLTLFAPPARCEEEVKPAPLRKITGRVVDHEGKPVSKAQVVLANIPRGHIYYSGSEHSPVQAWGDDKRVLLFFKARNGRATAEGLTDANGEFEIGGLMPGPMNVVAYHRERGVTTRANVVVPDAGGSLALRLDAPTFLEGRIAGLDTAAEQIMRHGSLDADVFHDGVFVRPDVAIGSDGTFKVGPLPAAYTKWRLSIGQFVMRRGFLAELLSVPVTTTAGETTRFDLDLAKGGAITGEIRGPKGEPLADVSVVVRPAGETRKLHGALTKKDGKYVIGGLSPGEYTLEAKRWRRRTAPG